MIAPVINPAVQWFASTVLSTPNPATNDRVAQLWGIIRTTTNTAFVLFVVVGGLLVTTRETLQSQLGLRELLPRLIAAFVAANVSLPVIAKIIDAVNTLTATLGQHAVDPKAAAARIVEQVTHGSYELFGGLLNLAIVLMLLAVLVTFVARITILLLLSVIAPAAMACHALPHTNAVAVLWWKAFAACLGTQLLQAAVFIAFINIFYTPRGSSFFGIFPTNTPAWINLLLLGALSGIMLKIPSWMRRLVFRGGGGGTVMRLIRTAVVAKTLGAVGLGKFGKRGAGGFRHVENYRQTVHNHYHNGPGRSRTRASHRTARGATTNATRQATGGQAAGGRWGAPQKAANVRWIDPDGNPVPAPRTQPRTTRSIGPTQRGLPPGSTGAGNPGGSSGPHGPHGPHGRTRPNGPRPGAPGPIQPGLPPVLPSGPTGPAGPSGRPGSGPRPTPPPGHSGGARAWNNPTTQTGRPSATPPASRPAQPPPHLRPGEGGQS